MKQLAWSLALCIPLLSNAENGSLDYPSVWRCTESRFHWYCDDSDRQNDADYVPASRKSQPIATPRTAEELRQELKRREDLAIMYPTDANLRSYLSLWQETQDTAARFSDQWRRFVWQNPELDYSQRRPTNNAAIKIQDESRSENEERQLRQLAKDHGLIFFFRSDCPYCHAMAPTLRRLAEQYGIEVLGVSLDGQGFAEFPNPRDGRREAAKWGIERVPALFIGSKRTGERAPVGYGMMALSEIINRIFVLTSTQPGQKF
jgi:conjugal transfer pilus assembly protein TraF